MTRNDASHLPEWQVPPIIDHKQYDAPSVFTPDSLLREARRQKNLQSEPVPAICILDPDGDIGDVCQFPVLPEEGHRSGPDLLSRA